MITFTDRMMRLSIDEGPEGETIFYVPVGSIQWATLIKKQNILSIGIVGVEKSLDLDLDEAEARQFEEFLMHGTID